MARTLRDGDQVRVYGGYDFEPDWLVHSPEGYVGTVRGFVEDPNGHPAAVVELDHEIALQSASTGQPVQGRYLLLGFAWTEMDWSTPGPRLHVQLLENAPTASSSEIDSQDAWIESHASWEFAD